MWKTCMSYEELLQPRSHAHKTVGTHSLLPLTNTLDGCGHHRRPWSLASCGPCRASGGRRWVRALARCGLSPSLIPSVLVDHLEQKSQHQVSDGSDTLSAPSVWTIDSPGAVASSSRARKLRIVAIPLASGASPERGVGSSPTACNFLFFCAGHLSTTQMSGTSSPLSAS